MMYEVLVVASIFHFSKSLHLLLRDVEDGNLDINKINKDLHLFQGDILQAKRRVARNAILDKKDLWDIPVPYVFEASLNVDTKATVLQAFEQFRLKSCIDFKPRESEQNYLTVTKDDGCYSYVSRAVKGAQTISIGENCNRIGIVEHEFLHALGFWHEQSRYDRDDYVTIAWENISDELKVNFQKLSSSDMTTLNAPYDYRSVMHYIKDAFGKNSKVPTIITRAREYQNVIGQRMEMSPIDVSKLNNLYNCGSSISFMEHCSFSDEDECGMRHCGKALLGGWRRMSSAAGGPLTDQTTRGNKEGYFMHASTVAGVEEDSARLQTRTMSPRRDCPVQCLQFYYFHSGNQTDQLNIWIREFRNESGARLSLMGQITGPPSFEWKLYHVPLDATKPFQVEFQVRKGAGKSSGGFSIDDINLSETECPHHIWEIKDFERILNQSDNNTHLYSPRFYSDEGFAFTIVVVLQETSFGVYVRLVSGKYDETLEWPCPWMQLTITLLDQKPHIQQRMSKRMSVTFDPSKKEESNNPHEVGARAVINGESMHVNTGIGATEFLSPTHLKDQDYLKGGVAVFLLTMKDISSLQHNSSLPCPELQPTNFTTSRNHDK